MNGIGRNGYMDHGTDIGRGGRAVRALLVSPEFYADGSLFEAIPQPALPDDGFSAHSSSLEWPPPATIGDRVIWLSCSMDGKITTVVDRGSGLTEANLARFTAVGAKTRVDTALLPRTLYPELYGGGTHGLIFERLRSATNACDWRPEIVSTSS